MSFLDEVRSSAMPGSPPELTGSKSSKSSSFHSYNSDSSSILEDVSNFEEIGLDDDSRADVDIGEFTIKTSTNPYDERFTSDLRATATAKKRNSMTNINGNQRQRELTAGKSKPPFPSLRGQVQNATAGLGLMPTNGIPTARRSFTSTSTGPSLMLKRHRSTSPNVPITARQAITAAALKQRRSSWQANRDRKTAQQLEAECDEDDGDDVPDECFLENVPISPRPPQHRSSSRPSSRPTSTGTSPERKPERKTMDRVRSVGNGTAAVPAEQGELRSPRTPLSPKPGVTRGTSMGQFPINHNAMNPKGRPMSWVSALSELSEEAKALTEALEAHADEEETKDQVYQKSSRSKAPRVKSAIAELPPLRRTDIMIDPLPISKEKEAVLSRTRPSWLPPKDPAEEKRHLKEYQRMMALSLKADEKKEAEQLARNTCKDDTASSLLRIWEEHVLPNWEATTSQKRTRELWWRGVAPRSRGAVWAKAIGNELGLTDASYTAALRRAQALQTTINSCSQLNSEELKKRRWLDMIERDVQSTYQDLRIFQAGGPLHDSLLDVLKAYAMYRSDVGYVHGTSTIAAILLLNLPTPSATFQALSNLLNRPLTLSFHTNDFGGTSRAYNLLLSTLKHKSPRLHSVLTKPEFSLQPDTYLRDLFQSMFTGCLSLDNATRLWDVLVFEGDALLVRAGVAFLTSLEGKLLGAQSAHEICQVIKAGLGSSVTEEDWMRELRNAGKSAA